MFANQKIVLIAMMIAFVEARFGQEQIPIQAIAQVTSGGGPGVAATIAGGAISNLLGAANPCDKLKTADNIIAQLGTGADALAAAIGFVASEQNFNPFATKVPTFCNDPTLPTTAALRGIVPLVDPAVEDSANANALSAASKATPFNADGLSVAQVFAAQGFTQFTTKDAAGAVGPAGADLAGGAAPAPPATPPAEEAPAPVVTEAPEAPAATDCPAPVTVTVTAGAPEATPAPEAPEAEVPEVEAPEAEAPPAEAPAGGDATKSTIAGLDFGTCSPAIKFEGGLGGRPATEFTFQAIDPVVALGQQEALNPAIIVNRVCDQLTNVCNANAAAKAACLTAKAAVDPAKKVAQTAVDFNTALGFASAFTAAAPPAAADPNAPAAPITTNPNVQKSTINGLDFGLCVPTIGFAGGRGNRAATEFTFQAIDPIVSLGQQEALNPAIIVNRVCDQLTNVCQANAAAKAACLAAKANVDPAKKVAQTAIDFNTALGFANADVSKRSADLYRKRSIEALRRRSLRV